MLICIRGNFLLAMLTIGTELSLFGIIILIWSFINSMMGAIHMRRLRKRLISYGTLNHNEPWKGRSRFYYINKVLLIVLAVIWVGVFFRMKGDYDKGMGKMSLYSYEGQVLFATMKDFVPEGKRSFIDYYGSSNYVLQRKDWLAPVILEWEETSFVSSPDREKVSGIWMVDYYETAAPWLARQVAREFLIRD